jgi:hypothetical protein
VRILGVNEAEDARRHVGKRVLRDALAVHSPLPHGSHAPSAETTSGGLACPAAVSSGDSRDDVLV